MKKTAAFVALVIILTALSLPSTVSPRGGAVTLQLTTCALKNIRIDNFDFSNNGEMFSIAAAPSGSSDTIESISIEFQEGSASVQSELVDIGPGRTVQEVNCPESFDQIIIDCFGS
jgi:hypothetical protein